MHANEKAEGKGDAETTIDKLLNRQAASKIEATARPEVRGRNKTLSACIKVTRYTMPIVGLLLALLIYKWRWAYNGF